MNNLAVVHQPLLSSSDQSSPLSFRFHGRAAIQSCYGSLEPLVPALPNGHFICFIMDGARALSQSPALGFRMDAHAGARVCRCVRACTLTPACGLHCFSPKKVNMKISLSLPAARQSALYTHLSPHPRGRAACVCAPQFRRK